MSLKNRSVLAVVALVGLCAGTAVGQHEAPKATKPAAPAAAPAAAQPEKPKTPEGTTTPEQQAAMQKAYEDAAKPGPMHEYLKSKVGTWSGKVKSFGPDGTAEESTCTTTIEMFLGGRFQKAETKGTMMKQPFGGVGIYGFDNVTQKFQGAWVDSMGTGMMTGTGDLSADKKVLTLTMNYNDPASKQEMVMKEVETTTGPDSFKLELMLTTPGGDVKIMEIDYTRTSKEVERGEAKPAQTAKPATGH